MSQPSCLQIAKRSSPGYYSRVFTRGHFATPENPPHKTITLQTEFTLPGGLLARLGDFPTLKRVYDRRPIQVQGFSRR